MTTAIRHRHRREPVLDVLPELVHYADTGCVESISCLCCPLPMCRYDDAAWYRAYKQRDRDCEFLAAYREEGLSVFQVAERFSVSPRTIQRALGRAGFGAPLGRPRKTAS